ncbi:MAG TPA: penicillin-binding transpeptidase domain-containing protein, partial [Rubrobacter sp.]|nr:penicillin-binding transpeptidase domain-containing protein [Rubrobacter sp.]
DPTPAIPSANPSAPASATPSAPVPSQEADLTRFFTNAEGTFVLLDGQTGRTIRHNPERARQPFSPASTFKIPNSLIALETGVASGPDFPLPWNPAVAPPPSWWRDSWKRDQTLRTAFRESVVWYYQELARRIGPERMLTYVQRFGYGNEDLSGGIDQFWLRGGLRISPDEQVEFLRRFHRGELGVSPRSTQIVKDVMLVEQTPEYKLSGKSGTTMMEGYEDRELAWFVGYVEHGNQVHFYALNMEGDSVGEDWPPSKRVELVQEILRELKILSRSVPE